MSYKKVLKIMFLLSIFILTGCVKNQPSKCTHKESGWIIDSEATCSNIGKKHTECIKCHEKIKEEEIEKLPHSLIHHEGKNATCTESGYKQYDTCENCTYTTYKEIKKLPHNLIHHEGKNATCAESGYKPYDTCEDCDYSTYEEIPYKQHTYLNYVCTECFESSPENIKYELIEDESGYYVVGLFNPNSQIKKIVIPNDYNGKLVVGVKFKSFYNCTNLNYIELSENITYIEGSLQSSLFYNEYDNGYYLGSTNNPYMVLITSKNKEIESIKINKDTKIIYDYALRDCSNLTSIEIPSNVTSIGGGAFLYCSSLESITIPSSVTSIGESAFYKCSSLENVYYNGTIEDWCNISFGNKYSNPMYYATHFYMLDNEEYYKEVTEIEIEIPDTITSIGKYQFYGFNNITKITIPSSVTSLGESAFEGCSNLTSITLPFIGKTKDTNEILGYFFGASNSNFNSSYVPSSLKEVKILEGCTSIGGTAFYNCSGLTSIEIPSSVTSIGYSAFYNCSGLTSIEIPSSVTSIGGTAFYNCSGLTSIEIPSSVTSIGRYTFFNCSGLTSIEIPSSVTSIGESAFYNCSGLTSIEIPSSVTSIGESAFKYCTSLKTVVFEENSKLTSIGESAFEGCSNLTSITLPFIGKTKDTNEILGYFFGASISNFNSSYVPSSLKEVKILKGCTSIGGTAFYNCRGLTSIEIPSSVTSIGYSAFYNCRGLTSIEIPSSVTSIGRYTFYNCSGLTSIEIPSSVTSIGKSAFSNCSGLTNVYYEGTIEDWCNIKFSSDPMFYAKHFYMKDTNKEYKEVKEIEIPDTITKIGSYQFCGFNNVTKITIPSSVTSIGNSAFSNCSGLTNVYYEGTIEDWCNIKFSSEYSNPMFYAKHFYMKDTNKEYKEVKEIEIPDTITKIGSYQFCGFNNVTKITIPSSVTSIGRYTFYKCSGLTIYCEATSKPSGWNSDWNNWNCPVVWGYKE